MKEIIVFSMGTRGDVQPYIDLARALTKAGHSLTIGTHPCWERLIKEAGINFLPVGPDVNMEYEAAVIRGKTKNPLFSMLKTMQFVFRIIEQASPDIYAACKGKDLVIVSHSQMGGVEAEALQLKTINVTLQTEMIPEVYKKKTLGGRLAGALINPQTVRPYNKIRKRYGLQAVKSMDMLGRGKYNLIPISRYVTPPNPNWHERNRVIGYWYQEEDAYQPDEVLKTFLSGPDKPVILALGAMSFESAGEKEKLELFLDAFRETGTRAVIQGFQKTLEGYKLPDTMLRVGSVPHSWLFRQGLCVIHHCGFGTTASSMLYGIPSIPVPHVLDQFAFAERLFQLGVGVKPIKAGELSREKIVSAIMEVKENYPALHGSVQALSQKMREEKGLETAVALVDEILEEA